MAKYVYETLNNTSNTKVGATTPTDCRCAPKRVVKKVYEKPEGIKNWVNQRNEELQKEIHNLYQIIENLKDGFEGKAIIGKNAIEIEKTDKENRVILKIDSEDKVLSQSEKGILSTLTLKYTKDDQKLAILGNDGIVVSSCIISSGGSKGDEEGGEKPSVTPSTDTLRDVIKYNDGTNTYVKFEYESGKEILTDIGNFIDIKEDTNGNISINGRNINLYDYLKLKTINGQEITGDGDIQITAKDIQIQTDWNQNDSTAVDYIKNKPEFKTINGQSIIGTGDISITGSSTGGIGQVSVVQSDWKQTDSNSADFIKNKPSIPTKTSELVNDNGFLVSHQPIKTINGQIVTGSGNLTLLTLTQEQLDGLTKLLALGISFSPFTEILTIGGKSYNLGKGVNDLTNRYWIGMMTTSTKNAFTTPSVVTDEDLFVNAIEKDYGELSENKDYVLIPNQDVVYIILPENLTIQKIAMGESPLQTVWENNEWITCSDSHWKRRPDIVKDDITYHVYGYRSLDFKSTKFEFTLQKN